MKKTLLMSLLLFTISLAFANGVVFNKKMSGSYLQVTSSTVNVQVTGQVSTTTTMQVFKNTILDSVIVKYAFPLPEGASAIHLRYFINNEWHIATFAAVPQDSTTGGGTGGNPQDQVLKKYLGANPLYFDLNHQIMRDSLVIVELEYVQLLPYRNGDVSYTYPNNYGDIQSTEIANQSFNFDLISTRTIDNIFLYSYSPDSSSNTGTSAHIYYSGPATQNYVVQYSLSLSQLGLYAMSTYIPDSLQKDDYGRGFFSFIVEPNPQNTDVIKKVFTLIIDKSGSMSGTKMNQAKETSKFIMNNLNPGDKFNLIAFDNSIKLFRSSHVDYTNNSRDSAILFINNLAAGGNTNISGAFDAAVPQFSVADTTTANIIIFFTDGQATSGIITTSQLITHINTMMHTSEKGIFLFTFGIGNDVNRNLLSVIANSNKGLATFLGNNDIESVISDFYIKIRYPVLINNNIAFSPAVINELHPSKIPNLYKGQQMIVVGRYTEPASLTVKLTGKAFDSNVQFSYQTDLSDSASVTYQFLTKLWAKAAIEDLMIKYYLAGANTPLASLIKDSIIQISINYEVISPFTSFSGGGNVYVNFERDESTALRNKYFKVMPPSPNPCRDFVELMLETSYNSGEQIALNLYNDKGKLFYTSIENVKPDSKYVYRIDLKELGLQKGLYIMQISCKDASIGLKIIVE
jgi:Ca-activated chloride channel family protein